jgi:hypothetical protein
MFLFFYIKISVLGKINRFKFISYCTNALSDLHNDTFTKIQWFKSIMGKEEKSQS